MQVYIQGTKKAANDKLAAGQPVYATEYVFMGGDTSHNAADLPTGCVVKFFEKYVGGNPYAKAYGQIKKDAKTGRNKIA